MTMHAGSSHARAVLRQVAILMAWSYCCAAGAAEPPEVTYLGNYPDDEFAWSELQNGVTHDEDNWYFTQERRLWKIPVGWDLRRNLDTDDLPPGVHFRGVPASLLKVFDEDGIYGYNHFGDLEYVDGFLFVPMEQNLVPPPLPVIPEPLKVYCLVEPCVLTPGVAVFRADDLSYVGFRRANVPEGQSRFPWIAFNPVDQYLYTSENTVTSERPLYRYHLDRARLVAECTAGSCDLDEIISFEDRRSIYEADGAPLDPGLGRYMQGADFSENGYLYLVSGRAQPEAGDSRAGIFVIDPAGRIVADSNNPDLACPFQLNSLGQFVRVCAIRDPEGSFRFEFDPENPTYQEPEGADWWDLDDGRAPGISGQLHVMLLQNEPDTDDIYFKHYHVAEAGCTVNCDKDGDGLTDAAEVLLGTDPGKLDTDGDGLGDGVETKDHRTDPLDADSDDDNLSDGDEIGVHHTDPLGADSDSDGLYDGLEVLTLGTNPLDVDSDDDGLEDGVEVQAGTNPLDADSDDDGLIDGRDVEFVEQQLLSMLDSAFRSRGPGAREQLLQHLTVLESAVRSNNLVAAKAALDILLRMMNGCGSVPDADDVVRDCASQPGLRELLGLLHFNLGLS